MAEESAETLHEWYESRRAEREISFHFELYEQDIVDLASGSVPPGLRAMFKAAADWAIENLRLSDANQAQVAHRKRKAAARNRAEPA